jgi:hypothetical protein
VMLVTDSSELSTRLLHLETRSTLPTGELGSLASALP